MPYITDTQQVPALIAELERRNRSKQDLVMPASAFRMATHQESGQIHAFIPIGFGNAVIPLELSPNGHAQTAAKLGIPKAYYDRMVQSNPNLLVENVNSWTARDDRRWLIRTLDGRIRANLSDRFRTLDNYDLAFATLQEARAANASITSMALSDDRFEMRLIAPDWTERIGFTPGDPSLRGSHRFVDMRAEFVPGVYVSNSETGKGGLTIAPFILDRVCTNGFVGEQTIRKIHLGTVNETGILSAETIAAKDATVWMEIRDLVRAVFDRERFKKLVERLTETAMQELEEPVAAVDAVVSRYELSDDDRQAILNELISPSHDRDPGRTVFGLISAITERAKAYRSDSAEDIERATDLEKAGMELAGTARELVAIRVR